MGIEYVAFDPPYQSRIIELRQVQPLVDELIAELSDRRIQLVNDVFRHNVSRVSELLALEMDRRESALFGTESALFETPVPKDDNSVQVPYTLRSTDPYLVSILRGGIVPTLAAQQIFKRRGVITLSAERQGETYDAKQGTMAIRSSYLKPPEGTEGRFLEGSVLAAFETMLATGNTIVETYTLLCERYGTPFAFLMGAVVAAKPGIEKIVDYIPNSKVYAGAIRAELNDHAYVIEGPGDAGAHTFGPRERLLDVVRNG